MAGLTLTIGDQANLDQDLANASGAFADTPYTIKWAEFASASTEFQAAFAGTLDAEFSSDLSTLTAISGSGVKLNLVSAYRNSGSGIDIVVQGNSSVNKVADLKGKTITLSSAAGGLSQYLLAHSLQTAGLKYSDVNVQFLPFADGAAAFAAKKIEIWGTGAPFDLAAVQGGGRVLVNGANGGVSGVNYISARPETLSDPGKKAALSDFIKRMAKAFAYSVSHADDYTAIYAKNHNLPVATAKVVTSSLAGYMVPASPDVIAKSQMVADFMSQIGVIKGVQLAPLGDTSLFPTALPGTPANGLP